MKFLEQVGAARDLVTSWSFAAYLVSWIRQTAWIHVVVVHQLQWPKISWCLEISERILWRWKWSWVSRGWKFVKVPNDVTDKSYIRGMPRGLTSIKALKQYSDVESPWHLIFSLHVVCVCVRWFLATKGRYWNLCGRWAVSMIHCCAWRIDIHCKCALVWFA